MEIRDREHRSLDLRGEVCPYTVLKSKAEMDKLAEGQLLKIIINNLPAVENIPRSLEKEGHSILKVEKSAEGHWEILARKKNRQG